jgi:translation initiation factor IF-3
MADYPREEVRGISRDLRINEQIRAREVRLIGQESEQLGVQQLRDALRLAADAGLDLVEVAPTARPPVCRIMDYGRFKYEQAKRDRDARKKQRVGDIKEVKMRPNIDDHDFDFKSRNAQRFLKEGNKVKVTVMFRGREIVHQDLARNLMARFTDTVAEMGIIERPAKLEGRNMILIVAPKAEVRAEARASLAAKPAVAPAGAPAPAPEGEASETESK